MRSRPLFAVLASIALASLVSTARPATAAAPEPVIDQPRGGPKLTAVISQSGLEIPWDVAFTPGGRMLVTEREGRVRIYGGGAPGAQLKGTTVIADVVAEGESGLMGIAVDHAYATNKRVYLCATRDHGGVVRNQVLAYTVSNNQLVFHHFVIKSGMQSAGIHNGCAVEHGPDGKLWVTMGDASNGDLAQDSVSLNGKVLRVNTDGSVPSDNPILPGNSSRTKAWTMGHRNPQGIAFQPDTGRVYAAEHGPELDDEINEIEKGANYGWPCYTDDGAPYDTSGCGPAGDYHDAAWDSGAPTIATSGAAFIDHSSWGDWDGDLFVSNLKQSDLRRFTVSADGYDVTQASILFDGTYGRLRAAVAGPNGRLWVTTSNGTDDKVVRIEP